MRRIRSTSNLATLAFALTALDLAACVDAHTVGPTEPVAPSVNADKRGFPNAQVTPGLATTIAHVTPTTVGHNTVQDGSTDCASVAPGSTAILIDLPTSMTVASTTVAGYTFTVSGGGMQIAFAPANAGALSTVIAAVLVKGGPGYDVYSYVAQPTASDAGLTSPVNNGGQISGISHYVVCTAPSPTPPTITKTLVEVSAGPDLPHSQPVAPMVHNGVQMYGFGGGQTLWVTYKIVYSTPVSSTITDDEQQDCAIANTPANASGGGLLRSQFTCSTNGFNATLPGSMNGSLGNPKGSINVPAGSGTIYITVDVHGNGYCGDRKFPNTAVLSAAGVTLGSSTVETWLWPGDTTSQCT